MAFFINGKPLAVDQSFRDADGNTYPSNFLRIATEEQKQALGITWEPDPTPVDTRFYWDHNLPKDHAQLVEQWVTQTKQTAGTLLASSDWYIVRQAETGNPVPPTKLLYRLGIREASNGKELQIKATTSTEELAAYITGSEYSVWPEEDELIHSPE